MSTNSHVLPMTVPTSKKSGIFTKKYRGKAKHNAIKERIEHWSDKYDIKSALKIMLQQGIISESKYQKTLRYYKG